MSEVFYKAGVAEQERRRKMENDLTKLTVEELYNLVHDFPRSLESDNAWPEIRHRLERLEKCEAELLEARAFQELRLLEAERLSERLEKCEALNKYIQHHPKCAFLESTIGNEKAVPCSCGYDAARAALEE